jgi:hypothetical protein
VLLVFKTCEKYLNFTSSRGRMAKKKTSHKKASKKPVETKTTPVVEPVVEKPTMPAPLLEIPYHEKKHVLLKGIAIHLMVYVILGLCLALIGVPPLLIFIVMMVLLWGLFVISYHFYHKK